MSNTKINKHGLTRYIKKSIKEQIRKDAGFGCVICGSLIVEYEHIEPEYHNAKVHDPKCMTILCPFCHDKVTKKRISKKAVWKAKEKPMALIKGFVNDYLSVETDDATFKIGSTVTSMTNVVLNIYGKPILWFEPPSQSDEPFKLCCVFYDKNSKVTAFINRNEFVGLVGDKDILSEGTRIEIVESKKHKLLVIDVEGDAPIHIKTLDMMYADAQVTVKPSGQLVLKQGKSEMTLDSCTISNCGSGFSFGGIPRVRKLNPIKSAFEIDRTNATDLFSFYGESIAWVLGNWIIDHSYCLVATVQNDNEVHSLVGDTIGYLHEDTLSVSDDELANGEPVWVSPVERNIYNVKKSNRFDVSYRINTAREPYQSPRKPNSSPVNQLPTISPDWYDSRLPADKNSRVTIDFEGSINSIPFEGGKAEGFTLLMGQGRMIDGFEDGIIGRSVGESFDVNVTFPSDYHAENLKGEKADFKVFLHQVERQSKDPVTV